MVTKLYIGSDRLDLYDDENISLKSSIADTQDITKNTTDFTKSFTVPASDINNRIFKHWYDATVDNTFDARIKVAGRIELDGIPFKTGKWRLSKVSVKSGKAESYTINFWGNLVDLSAKLKNDELKDLDLTDFDHAYTSANVKTGLTSSLNSGSIVYNLLVKKQLFYNSDSGEDTQTATLANIAFGAGSSTGIVWNTLRPSLRLLDIIEAIETKYSIVFSREFFSRVEFTGLYLWLNKDKNDVLTTSLKVDFDGGDTDNVNITTDIGKFNAGTGASINDRVRWTLSLTVTPDLGFTTVPYTVKCYQDDSVVKENDYIGTQTQSYTLNPNTDLQDYEIYYEIETVQDFEYTVSWLQTKKVGTFPVTTTNYTTTGTTNTITSNFIIADNIPKLKITDFLKGIFKACKLVIVPQEDGTLYVNTLKSYYNEGVLYDYTKYIDFDNYDVARGDILNEINYNFEDPQTILNIQYQNNNRIAYGDEEALLTDADGEPLDGTKLEYKVPFEQVVYERLIDLDDNAQTNIQYGAIVDTEINPVNPKPHIFYNINASIGAKTVAFIDDAASRATLGTTINTPSHTESFEDQQFAFVFSSDLSTWTGEAMKNNLYSNYHQNYVNDLFNIKRRNWSFTAHLPLDKLTVLELNDILKIRYDYYRIDNYTLNLLTGEAKLNLINAFDSQIGAFTPSQTEVYVDNIAQTSSIYVTFLDNYSYSKEDIGDGTTWITVTNVGSNVYFAFDANASGLVREMQIEFTNTDTSETFTIYLNQAA